jgi:hypothetical protein
MLRTGSINGILVYSGQGHLTLATSGARDDSAEFDFIDWRLKRVDGAPSAVPVALDPDGGA